VTPTSTVALVLFALVVLPGLLHESFRRARRAGRHDSAFVESARVVVGGVLVGLVAATLFGLLRLYAADALLSPAAALAEHGYLPRHLPLAAWSLAVYLALATAGALALAQVGPRLRGGSVVGHSAWVQLHARGPAGAEPHAWVRMDDGTEWSGRLREFSTDQDVADRELALGQPLSVRLSDGTGRDVNVYDRVVLRGDAIQQVALRWHTTGSASALPAPTRSDRVLSALVASSPAAAGTALGTVVAVAITVGVVTLLNG